MSYTAGSQSSTLYAAFGSVEFERVVAAVERVGDVQLGDLEELLR